MYRVTLSICLGCLSRFAAQMRFSPGGPVQRLAWIHVSMAEFGKQGERETCIPPIMQEAFMEMIGTTRSRVGSS